MKISRIFIVAFALVSSSCAANLDHEQSLQKGMSAYERGDFTEALKEWQTLAEEGNAAAQANLGSLYISGKGVPADDLEAAKWFTKAAFQSSVIAQLSLGYMHEKGLVGGTPNHSEATRWFRAAAKQGDARAQYQLGIKYESGFGIKQDIGQALQWYELAAAQGHAEAQMQLGGLYIDGKPIPQDDEIIALKWFYISAGVGNLLARVHIEETQKNMSSNQITAARKRAREWIRNYDSRMGKQER